MIFAIELIMGGGTSNLTSKSSDKTSRAEPSVFTWAVLSWLSKSSCFVWATVANVIHYVSLEIFTITWENKRAVRCSQKREIVLMEK